jgi:hypothetical protein
VLALALEAAAQCLWPTPIGPHAALPVFAGVFALAARTVFWRYAAPVLLVCGVAIPWWLGWTPGVAVHLLAGLVAAAVALAVPYRLRSSQSPSSAASLAPAEPIE